MAKRSAKNRWSTRVTDRSRARTVEPGVFTWDDPRRIAASLRRSARGHAAPYQSAMSTLTFYLNRAGRRVGRTQRRVLERAKDELRALFGR